MIKLFSRPKIGLALGSGGAKGLAHIGVIKALIKHHIPIDYIAGSSAGALFGGFYAATRDIALIEKIAYEINYLDMFRALADPTITLGLFKGGKIVTFLENYIGKVKVQDLSIPFCALATDIISGETIAIRKGRLSKAIRASISVPLLFHPLRTKSKLLIDGAASQPVPVQTVNAMGADHVIAVNLYAYKAPYKDKEKKLSKLRILNITIDLLIYHLAKENLKQAQVVISPNLPDTPLLGLVDNEELIKIGQKAAEEKMPEIKKLLRPKICSLLS